MTGRAYPHPLASVRAPLTEQRARDACVSLGPGGKASQRLVDTGLVPPDLLAGMTLFLLTGQPRPATASEKPPPSAVAGSVWVREHFTIHRPVRIGELLEVRGAVAGTRVRGGRSYSVSTSETFGADGERRISNCTTGLVRYRRNAALPDSEGGLDENEIERPSPDFAAAAENPASSTLRGLRVGDEIVGPSVRVTLAMMRARDGGENRNPIHTDAQAARSAGLAAPIAGGNHVLAFVLEALMQAWGPHALLHGACFDVRWVSQVRAGSPVAPRAVVTAVAAQRVDLALEVACEERVAMTGSLALPLASRGS